jgi:ribosomal protein L7/L12
MKDTAPPKRPTLKVMLMDPGENRKKVIKILEEVEDGLEVVLNQAPRHIRHGDLGDNITKAEAEELKTALESEGAKVKIDVEYTPIDYNVVLVDIGDNKNKVVKEISALAGIDLKEAEGLVEEERPIVAMRVTMDRAEEIQERLEMKGAKAKIEPVLMLRIPFEGMLTIDLVECSDAVLRYWRVIEDRPSPTGWDRLSFADLTFSEIAEAVRFLAQDDHFVICSFGKGNSEIDVTYGDPLPDNHADIYFVGSVLSQLDE